jgi:ADP-ribosyl-[dinitrogen reductase] hydrolase
MKYPNPNMLLRIAQADAYAIAVEYVNRKDHEQLFQDVLKFERFNQHPKYNKLRPGMFTDDTQMSIAIAEVLMLTDDPTSKDFSDAFFRCFKRDERDGYSRAFQAILEKVRTADEMRTALKPDSNRNGAAMRAVPLGVIKDPQRAMYLSGVQASITHQTWGGINSAAAVTLMSNYALHNKRDFITLYDNCVRQLPAFELFRTPWEGPIHHKLDKRAVGVGMMTAHAVFTLLTTETSLMGMMRRIIEWGGDTDSVAAIAWGIASARYPNEQLPEFLETKLEVGGEYGVDFLKDLGSQLMAKY